MIYGKCFAVDLLILINQNIPNLLIPETLFMKYLIATLLLLITVQLSAQQKIRKLPPSINHPAMDVYTPFISLDGSTLLFTMYYGLERLPLLYYSVREYGDWRAPVELPKTINSGLTFFRGYTLSPDGNVMYITSIKSGGVGGYDIYWSERRGNTWSAPQNIFAPINSKLHDSSPTFTPDGKTVYFMRCEKMDKQSCDNCTLFSSSKNITGQWQEPVELPASINKGNSQTPRIMADGETLIFASNKHTNNKGGFDLYLSKRRNGMWSEPVALDFTNTAGDDQFVSAVATGRYLLRDAKGDRRQEIQEHLIPDEIRPKGVMKIDGTITGANGTKAAAYVAITDGNGNRIFSGQPDAGGKFFAYVTEGSTYELSIEPEDGTLTYYAKQYDLTGPQIPMFENVNVELKPLKPGDEIALDAITFKKYSSEVIDNPAEFRRLSRLLKTNAFRYELQVLLQGYEEDSVQSTPDLTEMISDTVIFTVHDIDTLGQLFDYDSIVVQTHFHNNRTDKQAEALLNKLETLGISRNRFAVIVNARPEEYAEKRKTVVKLVVLE